MPSLCFRLPGSPEALGARLALLLPTIDRVTRRRWIEQARVRVDGHVAKRLGQVCRAGARIEVDPVPESAMPGAVEIKSSDWWAWVDAPPCDTGMIVLADGLALEMRVVERRAGLAVVLLAGSVCEAQTLCAGLARSRMPVVGDLCGGGLGLPGGAKLRPLECAGPGVTGLPLSGAISLDSLQEVPWPGLPAISGASGLPSVPGCRGAGPGVAKARTEAGGLRLRVSDETLQALGRGHPWILPDEASESAQAFRPGTLVRVEARDGRRVAGWAHIEGSPRLAARVWAAGPLAETEIASVESRVARALARRRSLLSGSAPESEGVTNAYRLIHGEADGLPGLIVDRLGPLLRVLVTGRSTEGFRAHALDALRGQLPCSPEGQPWCVLEVQNLRQTGPVVFDAVRWLEGDLATLDALGAERRDSDLCVEERGLRFWVDPGWDAPRRPRPGFGLFLDQRENRARLAARAAAGGRWLNLFSHTGAFSASLLAAGASVVESVDLSAPYLARLEANLASNRDRGVDPTRHRSIRSDVRRYLESLDDERTFAGIVLDPPTAAAAGRRFWSVRQDLEPLLGLCVRRLDAGGSLLVTQNRRGPPLGLDRILERVAARAHRRVAGLEPAPAGLDHPSLAGFPEGDAFEGWLLSLD